MASLFEGDFVGRCVNAEVGTRGNKPLVRIEMEITEGDKKGRRVAFEGKLDEKAIKYTKMAMVAVGWKGRTVVTFVEDVKAANVTVPFEVEIASYDPKDGTRVREWSTVRRIGTGGKPLDAIDKDTAKKFDNWFAEAGDVGDAAAAPSGNGAARDRDLPF